MVVSRGLARQVGQDPRANLVLVLVEEDFARELELDVARSQMVYPRRQSVTTVRGAKYDMLDRTFTNGFDQVPAVATYLDERVDLLYSVGDVANLLPDFGKLRNRFGTAMICNYLL